MCNCGKNKCGGCQTKCVVNGYGTNCYTKCQCSRCCYKNSVTLVYGNSNGYSNGYTYCAQPQGRCCDPCKPKCCDPCKPRCSVCPANCPDKYKWAPKRICCEEVKLCWNDCKPKKCCKVKSCSSKSTKSCSSKSTKSCSSKSSKSKCTSKPKIVNGKKKWCCKSCKNKYYKNKH